MVEMKLLRSRNVLASLVVLLVLAGIWTWARSAAVAPLAPTAAALRSHSAQALRRSPTPILTVETDRPGSDFEVGAVGLSTETLELSSGHLSADHRGLVRLMRQLGPSVLRIGGDSVDFSWWTSSGELPPPWATSIVTPADLSALHGLLVATGWRAMLGVDLGHFEPARAADEARYARHILGASLLGIEIGNEPNVYGTKDGLRQPTYGFAEYLSELEAYRRSLGTTVPGIALYGPALTQKNMWLTPMGSAVDMFTEITQHYYPSNTCTGATRVALYTVQELLSPAVRRDEDEFLEGLALTRNLAGRPTRIGETNDSACGGIPFVSPVFASALWALDWALRAANSGVQALNFHGNLGVCGSHAQSPICATTDEADRSGDLTAQPEYYGLLAARQLEGGRFVPTRLNVPDPLPDLTTWATVAPNGTVKIAIDNLATAGLAQPVSVSMPGYYAAVEQLVGPSDEARGGIAFSGSPVTSNGLWRPRRARSLPVQSFLRVVLRPASAVVIVLHRQR
jgi:hypothetical protein